MQKPTVSQIRQQLLPQRKMTEFDEVKYWHSVARKHGIRHKDLSIFEIIEKVKEVRKK